MIPKVDDFPTGVWGLDTRPFDYDSVLDADWDQMRRAGLRWLSGNAEFQALTAKYGLNWLPEVGQATLKQARLLHYWGIPTEDYYVIEQRDYGFDSLAW